MLFFLLLVSLLANINGECKRRLSEEMDPDFTISRVWWNKAQAICNKTGSDLVSIRSQHEDELVKDYCSNELHWHCWIGLFAPSCFYNYSLDTWIGEFNGTWIWTDGAPYDENEFNNWCPGFPTQGDNGGICDGGIHVFYDIHRGCWRNGYDGMYDDQSDPKWWKYYVCNSDIITVDMNIEFEHVDVLSYNYDSNSNFNQTPTTTDLVAEIEEVLKVGKKEDRNPEMILYLVISSGMILFIVIASIILNRLKRMEATISLIDTQDTLVGGKDTDEDTITSYPFHHKTDTDDVDYDFCDDDDNQRDQGIDENEYVFCDDNK